MGFRAEDGKGRGFQQGVNKVNRALVQAEQSQIGHFVSQDDGLMFNVISTCSSVAAGNFMLYYENTDEERDFYVDLVRVQAATNATWIIHEATGSTGASTLTPVNMNLGSGKLAKANVRGNAILSSVSTGPQIAIVRSAAGQSQDIPFDDVLILGTGNAIAVEYDAGSSGAAEVLVRGYYRNPNDER